MCSSDLGDCQLYLNIGGDFDFAEAARNLRRLDSTLLSSAMSHTANGLSVLALFPGGLLIVPAIWTWVTTAKRVRAMRAIVLSNGPGEYPSVGLAVLLSFLYSLQHPYLQVSLNGTWDLAGGTSAAVPPPAPPAQ